MFQFKKQDKNPKRVSAAAAPQAAAPNADESSPEGIVPLPSFKNCPANDRQALFIRKLRLCSKQVDLSNPDNGPQKEIKRLNLLEIMDYINTTKGVFNEDTFSEITEMIRSNLFRGIAPNYSPSHAQYDPDEDEPVLEAAWPHLQYVYEFLLRFVVSNEIDPKMAKKYITTEFLEKLLDLFDSEDPRERDYLKTILHRIYGKFMPHRAFIRKSINSIFYCFIYETERHNGIAELLEILGSIINGFALPLKDEHKQFLFKALLPLHKVRHVSMYHQQLSYCVTQFVEKDPKLAAQVIRHILEYWPCTFSAKEVLFLNEVEEIIEICGNESFLNFHQPLFERIARCVASPHFQVAERALCLWNNEHIVSLIWHQRQVVLPIVIGALYNNSQSHWNSTVLGLTVNVIKLFQETDAETYDKTQTEYLEEQKKIPAKDAELEQTWAAIDKVASTKEGYDDVAKYSETKFYHAQLAIISHDLNELDLTSNFAHLDIDSSATSDALKRKSVLPTKATHRS